MESDIEPGWVVDALSDGVVVHDARGQLRHVSARAAELLGTTVDELLGADTARVWLDPVGRPRSLWHPDMPPQIALRSGSEELGEYRHELPDGDTRWARITSRRVEHPVLGEVVISQIVDSTRIQQFIREIFDDFEQRFEVTWARSSVMMTLLEVNGDDIGRITRCNDAATAFLAGSGAPPADGELLLTPMIADVDREAFLAIVADISTGLGEGSEFDTVLTLADGSRRDVRLSLGSARLPTGRAIAATCVITDTQPLRDAIEAQEREERRAATFLEHAADVVVVIDAAGTIEWASPAVLDVMGYQPSDLVGTNAFDFLLPDEQAVVLGAFERTKASAGRKVPIPVHIPFEDGVWHRMELVATNLMDDDDVGGIVLSLRDLTARDAAEQALAMYSADLERVINLTGLCHWHADADGRLTKVNESLCALIGADADELLGHEALEFVHEDDRARVPGIIARRSDAGVEAHEVRFCALDGSIARMHVSAAAIEGPNGEYLGTVGFAIDLTKALNTYDEMVASQAQLAALLSALPDIMVQVRRDGTYGTIRSGGEGGVVTDDDLLEGLNIGWSGEMQDPDAIKRAVSEALDTGRVVKTEAVLRTPEGGWFPFEARLCPISEDEAIMLVRGTEELRELTETKIELERQTAENEQSRLTAELERMRRHESLGRLAGGVAHDVNNLLGVIGNYAAAIVKGTDDPRVHDDIDHIREAVRRGASLTERLLLFGNAQQVNVTLTDVADVARNGLHLIMPSIPRSIEVTERFDDEAFTLIDKGRLDQVLLNLVLNSANAIGTHGRIDVTTYVGEMPASMAERLGVQPGRYVALGVTDDGPGMTADVASRAIDPFFSGNSRGRGSGLGLSIVHGVVHDVGGAIDIVTAPGEGTRITCYFPAALGAPGPVARPPAPQPPSGPKVLVVDDDIDVRHSTAALLRSEGCQVLESEGALAALELLEREGPVDIVLTDLRMPDVDGVEFAELLRERDAIVPIIFVSGYSHMFEGRVPSGPTYAALNKPYDADRLIETMSRLLAAGVRVA